MPISVPDRQARLGRFKLLALVAAAGFALIAVGLLRLQVLEHQRYAALSKENRVRLEVLRAPRGAIYDRHGELLADSAPSFNILFRPFPAESAQRAALTRTAEWITRVAALVELDTAEVRVRVRQANRTGRSSPLMRAAPFRVLAAVEETRSELPGIEVQVEPMRRYPNGALAGHLLGYAGEINDLELDSLSANGYQSGDLLGRSGVEKSYEEILRGRDGAEFVVVNAMGKRVSALAGEARKPPRGGHDLVLTIDLGLQRALEEAMAGVRSGAAVAIDPRDGGVLAMVSRPAIDPNEFSRGLSHRRWNELTSGGANPLLDRAIQGVYPPGSTFKIVSMMAALKAGLVKPETRLAGCTGSYTFGGRAFGCWNRKGHGSLNLTEALQHSCDVYFYQVGLMLGLERLEQAARGFGLGTRTGIDLPQERRGLVPDASWYDRRWGAGNWRKGLLLNLVIGQGELLTTPLQLAVMAAEAANGGVALRPHVIREVRGLAGYQTSRPVQAGFEASGPAWHALHESMRRVVESGTGTAARVPGVVVAGKTGTAQNPHGDDHALFVCYAPADSPTVAMAFVIENAGHGGSVAAPLAGQVLRRVLAHDTTAVTLAAARRARAVVRDSTARTDSVEVAGE
ncbi:MAG: penicillin-binding protein 2 [Candidatus Eisenbacteria bacterium]